MFVFILGTAGSGKTTFATRFNEYLKNEEESILINLDPGNDLESDINIREFVKTEDVMKKFNLGPNSAIIKSIELVYEKIDLLLSKIPDVYWKVVDTPGQLELFLYRDVGKKVIRKFKEIDDEVALIFLVDVQDVLTPENFVSILAWNVIISLKLEIKALTVINKKDLISEDVLNKIKNKIVNKVYLKELSEKDALSDIIARSFSEFYEYSTIWKRPLFISAKYDKDFYEVKSTIQELFCACGDIS